MVEYWMGTRLGETTASGRQLAQIVSIVIIIIIIVVVVFINSVIIVVNNIVYIMINIVNMIVDEIVIMNVIINICKMFSAPSTSSSL